MIDHVMSKRVEGLIMDPDARKVVCHDVLDHTGLLKMYVAKDWRASGYLRLFFFFFFEKAFGGHMSFFWGHWYPCLGFLVTSPLGFKARVGCLIRIAEANVMYVPRDPPLVLHMPTSWRPARSRSCPHILLPAEVRLPGFEP